MNKFIKIILVTFFLIVFIFIGFGIYGALNRYSKGLTFERLYNKVLNIDAYVITGVGTCNDKDIIIPSKYKGKKVIAIDEKAFIDCDFIRSVSIADSIVGISDNAFANCENLESVYISKSVEYLSLYSFYCCPSLISIKVDKKNKVFDSRDNCNAIIRTKENELILACEESVIPDTVVSIDYHAFINCDKLKTITIPKSVSFIDWWTFYYCKSLEKIIIDEENPYYDSRENCNAVINSKTDELIKGTSLSFIPSTVKSIGDKAFENCIDLKNIVIPNGVESIGYMAFYACQNLVSIEIPDTVISIMSSAFDNCKSLKEVKLSSNIETISNSLFEACEALEKIEIFNKVSKIGSNAFKDCISLKEVVLSNNLQKVDYDAFLNCVSLENVYYDGKLTEWKRINFHEYSDFSNPLSYAKNLYLKNEQDEYYIHKNWFS